VLTGSRGAKLVFLSWCGGSAREGLMRCAFVARFLFAPARRADHVFVFKDGSRGSVSSLALGSDRDVFSSEVFERQNAKRRQGLYASGAGGPLAKWGARRTCCR
jgi:hypothetical protein